MILTDSYSINVLLAEIDKLRAENAQQKRTIDLLTATVQRLQNKDDTLSREITAAKIEEYKG